MRRKTIPTTKIRDFYNLLSMLSAQTQMSMVEDFLRRNKVTRLVDIYEGSKEHFSSYNNIEEDFLSHSHRKPLPVTFRAITGTNNVISILEASGTNNVKNGPSLAFEYIEREVSPIRTKHGRFDTGKSGRPSGTGGIDFIGIAVKDSTPILGEVKINHDGTPFSALIQLLTYLSELATPNQRNRINRWRLFDRPVATNTPFNLYVLTCHTKKKPQHWNKILRNTEILAKRLKARLNDDINDIVFLKLDAKAQTIRKI